MKTGAVYDLQAFIEVVFKDDRKVSCVIDTGFAGHLALPLDLVAELDLTFSHEQRAELADASNVYLDVYYAVVEWQGFAVEVDVIATGNRALLGTGLLAGWELRAQFIEGGLVRVNAIEAG